MEGEADLASIGALLSDTTRAAILRTLLNGGLTPASVLAETAGVSRSLASGHLRRLTEGGLIVVEPQGRRRLYRLAGQHVADALEALMLLAPALPVRSLSGARERDDLRAGRLCYDHVAGRAGVELVDGLVGAGHLEQPSRDGYAVTARGEEALAAIGVDVDVLRTRPRPLARPCPDRSEGRHHLAGSLGAALTTELLRRDWLAGREASRVVSVTAAGRSGLRDAFGVSLTPLTHDPRSDSFHAR
jgi:DNA-binding transcriptional ArsR family regulator